MRGVKADIIFDSTLLDEEFAIQCRVLEIDVANDPRSDDADAAEWHLLTPWCACQHFDQECRGKLPTTIGPAGFVVRVRIKSRSATSHVEIRYFPLPDLRPGPGIGRSLLRQHLSLDSQPNR